MRINSYKIGINSLLAGCFLLPTSGYIGPILIFVSCLCGSYLQGFKSLFVKKMYPLYLLAVLMLISVFLSPFGFESSAGVFNWLPFFWLFWSLSVYFKDKDNIKAISTCLVCGTIPVLIIGFSQLLFGFSHSPRLFGSFIVWHLSHVSEFTGIFYNRNICAAWLAANFPLFIAATYSQAIAKNNFSKQTFAFLALLSISVAMFMTNSRNALGALFFGTFSMSLGDIKKKDIFANFIGPKFVFLVCSLLFVLFVYLGAKFDCYNFLVQFISDPDRVEIWNFGLHIGSKNFFVGFGSGGFLHYVSLLSPFDRPVNHVHVLPLDLLISYGLFALIIFMFYVFGWLIMAIRSGILGDSIFCRAWFISFVLLIALHITDLPYLDARINLVGWLLLTGIVSYVESSDLASGKS